MKLFVYGTLQDEALASRFFIRPRRAHVAELIGYQRVYLRGRDYPGVRPRPGCSVHGRVYHGLRASELNLLDRFEGLEYRRRRLPVRIDGIEVPAWVYVPDKACSLSDRPWDFSGTRLKRLARRFY